MRLSLSDYYRLESVSNDETYIHKYQLSADNFEDILSEVSMTFFAKSGIVFKLIVPLVPERDMAAIARP